MKFKQLPLIAKIAIVLTFFNTWVMFEEFVIDRFGYWRYLPFYKKGLFCIWDITFIFITTILIFANWKFIKTKCFILNCRICINKV
jgi:uncharacterized membrane protein